MLLRLMAVVLPEQNVCEVGVIVRIGVGDTVTLTVCVDPAQAPVLEVGVTV